MDGTGRLFSEFVAALPVTIEAVAVSYPTGRYLSYPELENLVRAICPAAEPFFLMAESFSAPLALKYAATIPGNLQGLILCAGFAASPLRGWRRSLTSLLAPFIFHVTVPNFAAKRWLIGADSAPSLLAAVQAAISCVQPRVLAARLRAVLTCDVRAEAGLISAPILYIRGKQDRLVGAWCLEELRRIRPQIAVTALEGPHLIIQREPRRVAEIVVRFIQSDRPPPIGLVS